MEDFLTVSEILSYSCVCLLRENSRILNSGVSASLDIPDYRLPAAVTSIAVRPMLGHPIIEIETVIVVVLTRGGA